MTGSIGSTGSSGSSSTSTFDQSDVQAFTRTVADSAEPVTRSAEDQFNRMNLEDGRVRITLGGALLLTLLGSMATALYIRRQARARARQLIWFALMSRASSAIKPNARQIAPVGGVGGSLLVAALIAARVRNARAQESQHGLETRLAALESQLQSRGSFAQPRPRDMMIGMAIGMGISRVLGGRGKN
jgi:hypothetical protein